MASKLFPFVSGNKYRMKITCVEIKNVWIVASTSTPSTRRLLDSVAAPFLTARSSQDGRVIDGKHALAHWLISAHRRPRSLQRAEEVKSPHHPKRFSATGTSH